MRDAQASELRAQELDLQSVLADSRGDDEEAKRLHAEAQKLRNDAIEKYG